METAAEKARMEVAVRPARKRAVAAYAYGNGKGKKKKVEREKMERGGGGTKKVCVLSHDPSSPASPTSSR